MPHKLHSFLVLRGKKTAVGYNESFFSSTHTVYVAPLALSSIYIISSTIYMHENKFSIEKRLDEIF